MQHAAYRAGQARSGGLTVNAPWYTLRLRTRRLPLVLDAQGTFVARELVDRLLLGLPPPKRRPRA